jgi:hypothetical protein
MFFSSRLSSRLGMELQCPRAMLELIASMKVFHFLTKMTCLDSRGQLLWPENHNLH